MDKSRTQKEKQEGKYDGSQKYVGMMTRNEPDSLPLDVINIVQPVK